MILCARFPFDWNNPIGYSIAVGLQMWIVSFSLRFVAPFTSYAMVAFIFACSICKDLRDDIRAISERAIAKETQSAVEKCHETLHYASIRRFGICDEKYSK